MANNVQARLSIAWSDGVIESIGEKASRDILFHLIVLTDYTCEAATGVNVPISIKPSMHSTLSINSKYLTNHASKLYHRYPHHRSPCFRSYTVYHKIRLRVGLQRRGAEMRTSVMRRWILLRPHLCRSGTGLSVGL